MFKLSVTQLKRDNYQENDAALIKFVLKWRSGWIHYVHWFRILEYSDNLGAISNNISAKKNLTCTISLYITDEEQGQIKQAQGACTTLQKNILKAIFQNSIMNHVMIFVATLKLVPFVIKKKSRKAIWRFLPNPQPQDCLLEVPTFKFSRTTAISCNMLCRKCLFSTSDIQNFVEIIEYAKFR